MSLNVAVLMDPIAASHRRQDTTFAMLLEAQRRGHDCHVVYARGLALRDGVAWAHAQRVSVRDHAERWFETEPAQWQALHEFDLVLARRDPPVDDQFLYDTMVLESAQLRGTQVVNDPRSLRDCNEKLFAAHFPQCCAPTLVSRDADELVRFVTEHDQVVLKPLDGMGGRGIFRSHVGDPNLKVIIESLLGGRDRFAIAQRYVAEIRDGDKRILLIDGEPVPYALARIPAADDFRGNLAAGARGEGRPLTERDRAIAAQVGPELRRRGLRFVGLDVIGDWLTEINVTSPTGVRELDAQFGLNIAGQLFDAIEK